MTDEEIQEILFDLIETHLDEENSKAAHEWLVKRCASYEALRELKLTD